MQALEEALRILEESSATGEEWTHQDDLCDCTFQRIGYWYNPYIGETLEVRWCCVWKELFKLIPGIQQFLRTTHHEPAEWNGETEMPKAIWYRQVRNMTDMELPEIRAMDPVAPAGKPIKQKPIFFLPWSGEYLEVQLG